MPPDRPSLTLMDLATLMVGFGMAGLLIRAFWPTSGPLPSPQVGVALGLLYVWLGLAMGGPLALLRNRRRSDGAPSYTWAETAWLIIGVYWIGLAVLVVPTRLRVSPIFGVFPIVAGLVLRIFSGGRPAIPGGKAAWTHRLAVWLLLTWPLAWLDLILLSQTL